jgi:hypothetical protein
MEEGARTFFDWILSVRDHLGTLENIIRQGRVTWSLCSVGDLVGTAKTEWPGPLIERCPACHGPEASMMPTHHPLYKL